MKNCQGLVARLGLASLAVSAAGAETGRPAPPVVVAVVLDASGSLKATQLEQARCLALAILESLPPASELTVFAFDDQSRRVQARNSDPETIAAALARIRIAGRFTALHDALYDASRYLREAPPARKAVVLFTDGGERLVLDDASASSQHCRIRAAPDGGFVLHDLGSTNGTFVNDRRVTLHPLAEGDRIRVGETVLELRRQHRGERDQAPATPAFPASPSAWP